MDEIERRTVSNKHKLTCSHGGGRPGIVFSHVRNHAVYGWRCRADGHLSSVIAGAASGDGDGVFLATGDYTLGHIDSYNLLLLFTCSFYVDVCFV